MLLCAGKVTTEVDRTGPISNDGVHILGVLLCERSCLSWASQLFQVMLGSPGTPSPGLVRLEQGASFSGKLKVTAIQ